MAANAQGDPTDRWLDLYGQHQAWLDWAAGKLPAPPESSQNIKEQRDEFRLLALYLALKLVESGLSEAFRWSSLDPTPLWSLGYGMDDGQADARAHAYAVVRRMQEAQAWTYDRRWGNIEEILKGIQTHFPAELSGGFVFHGDGTASPLPPLSDRNPSVADSPEDAACWLTVTEAADLVKENRGTISKAATKGAIRSKGTRGSRRIERESVLQWSQKRQQTRRQRQEALDRAEKEAQPPGKLTIAQQQARIWSRK